MFKIAYNLRNISQNLTINDLAIMFIFALGPVFGSLITFVSCMLGLLYFLFLLLGWPNKRNFHLNLISGIFFLYIFYFIVNGFFKSGVKLTLISMAPNLPLLGFAVVALTFNWDRSKISSKVIGNFSSLGVLISVTIASLLYVFIGDLEISDLT